MLVGKECSLSEVRERCTCVRRCMGGGYDTEQGARAVLTAAQGDPPRQCRQREDSSAPNQRRFTPKIAL